MGWNIKNPPGVRPAEQMRALFEKSIRSTPVFARNYTLGASMVSGEFRHYTNPETEAMWIGFAIGMRCADRLDRAALKGEQPAQPSGTERGEV